MAAGLVQALMGRAAKPGPHHFEGMHFTRALAEHVAPNALRSDDGVLRVSESTAQAERWQARMAHLPEGEAEWLEGAALQEVVPGLGAKWRYGLRVCNGFAIDGAQLVQGLWSAAGIQPLSALVTRVVEHPGHVEVTLHNGTTLPSDVVVLAAGAHLPELLRACGWQEPAALRSARGEVLLLRATPPRLPISGGAYLVPIDHATVLVGATHDERTPHLGLTASGIHTLRERAANLMPSLARAPLLAARAGVRPATASRLPCAGRLPGSSRVHVFCGLGTKGLLLGPLGGARLAEAIVTGDPRCLPEGWPPQRDHGMPSTD